MRILVVSPHFPPWNSVAALRLHAFAKSWAKTEQVEVLTTYKRADHATEPRDCSGIIVHEVDYRIPRVLEKLRQSEKESSGATVAGAKPNVIKRTLKSVRARTGIFSSLRMPDLTDYWVKPAIAKGLSLGKFDVVFASVGPYTSLRVGEALAKAGSSALVADYRDLWTDNQIFSGFFPFTLREKALERWLLKQASLVTTVSEPLAAKLRTKTASPVRVVPNGFVRADFEVLETASFFPDDGVFRIGFTGRVYWPGHDPRPLLKALARLSTSHPGKARFVVAGPDREFWLRLAEECDAKECIEHVGSLPRQEALRLQRDCDALAVFEWKDANEGQMSTKVFEYLGAGPPVLVVGGPSNGSVASLVLETGSGIATGSDEEAIEKHLVQLLSQPRRARRLSTDPRVLRYERGVQAQTLLEELRGLTRPDR